MIAARYLHTAYRNGLHAGNPVLCKAYLLRSLTDTESQSKGLRRKVFRKKKIRQVRTLQWVTASYRPARRRYASSASDANSSDELLKPIYE